MMFACMHGISREVMLCNAIIESSSLIIRQGINCTLKNRWSTKQDNLVLWMYCGYYLSQRLLQIMQ